MNLRVFVLVHSGIPWSGIGNEYLRELILQGDVFGTSNFFV
jgi:hypothetical protein